VSRSLQRSRTRGLIFEEPKTEKSRRSIRLAPAVVAALKAHRKRQAETRLAVGPLWRDGDLVFCTGIGTPIDSRALGLDYDRMIEKSELPRIRLHDLRHTFATIGLGKNIHPKVMSEMLGHSKIALTLDVYSHALPSLQADAADKIADALTKR
jgi:integrase